MFEVINEQPVPYEENVLHPRLYRHYRRLRAIPSGRYGNQVIRAVFGYNGQFVSDRMIGALLQIGKDNSLDISWIRAEGGVMHYRLTLNPLTDVDGVDALNNKDVFAPESVLINLFSDLQEKVLKARKTPTIADRATAKRMLKDIELDLALKLVRAYWNLRAERRTGSVFKDFYYQYPSLLNDVVDELEVERGQAVRDARRTAKPDRAAFLRTEIARRKQKNQFVRHLEVELEALLGQE